MVTAAQILGHIESLLLDARSGLKHIDDGNGVAADHYLTPIDEAIRAFRSAIGGESLVAYAVVQDALVCFPSLNEEKTGQHYFMQDLDEATTFDPERVFLSETAAGNLCQKLNQERLEGGATNPRWKFSVVKIHL